MSTSMPAMSYKIVSVYVSNFQFKLIECIELVFILSSYRTNKFQKALILGLMPCATFDYNQSLFLANNAVKEKYKKSFKYIAFVPDINISIVPITSSICWQFVNIVYSAKIDQKLLTCMLTVLCNTNDADVDKFYYLLIFFIFLFFSLFISYLQLWTSEGHDALT